MSFEEEFPSLSMWLYEFFTDDNEREILQKCCLDKQRVREAILKTINFLEESEGGNYALVIKKFNEELGLE